jgi:hypothetical protein
MSKPQISMGIKKAGMLLLLIGLAGNLFAQGLKPLQRVVVQPPPVKAKFHLYLLIGQSNMAGRGYPEAVDTTANVRVLRLNQAGQWEIAKDPIHFDKSVAGVGPGLEFGKAMAEADPTVTIGLIPCAVGGSGIDVWKAGAFYAATKTKPYDDAIARGKTAKQSGTLMGIIWHQGESDSSPQKSVAYADNLTAVIASLRADLQAPNVPFVAGQLPDFQIHQQDSTGKAKVNNGAIKVNEAVASLKGLVKNYAFVTAEGTDHRGDHLHFNAVSARLMGRRYAKQMLELQKQKK